MGVLAFEPFDESGGCLIDGAQLAAIIARFGGERRESVAAIAESPLKQGVDGNLTARGVRDEVKARGDLLGAARQLTAGQGFENQRGDESVTK